MFLTEAFINCSFVLVDVALMVSFIDLDVSITMTKFLGLIESATASGSTDWYQGRVRGSY